MLQRAETTKKLIQKAIFVFTESHYMFLEIGKYLTSTPAWPTLGCASAPSLNKHLSKFLAPRSQPILNGLFGVFSWR